MSKNLIFFRLFYCIKMNLENKVFLITGWNFLLLICAIKIKVGFYIMIFYKSCPTPHEFTAPNVVFRNLYVEYLSL